MAWYGMIRSVKAYLPTPICVVSSNTHDSLAVAIWCDMKISNHNVDPLLPGSNPIKNKQKSLDCEFHRPSFTSTTQSKFLSDHRPCVHDQSSQHQRHYHQRQQHQLRQQHCNNTATIIHPTQHTSTVCIHTT